MQITHGMTRAQTLRLGKVPLCLAILFAVFRFRRSNASTLSWASKQGALHPYLSMAAAASPFAFYIAVGRGLRSRARVHPLDVVCFLRRRTRAQIIDFGHCFTVGANFLLKPAPPPMATISLYTTAPPLAQADEILDTNISILPFSPDLLQTPKPSPLRTPLHSWPPHLILDATPKPSSAPKHPARPHPLPPPPSTRRLTGLSDDMQVTPYLHRQRLRFVLALGGLSECARSTLSAPTHSHFWPPGLGLDVYALPEAVQADLLVQQIEKQAKAHFWVAVLSLESVHRLGASERRSAFWVTWCRSSGGPGEVEGTEEEERVQKKMQELRDKDVVKRERGAECVKGIADLVFNNGGGLEEAWAELEGFIRARMNA
ncbi:hypothetical protein B0H14DRAFT_3754020 [Mycena olivaceomarginata]|nr:hypothetical protein B0H14DRAFT_3754020 [Mycena olivaceomarginata]